MKATRIWRVLVVVCTMLALSMGQTAKAYEVEIGDEWTVNTDYSIPVNTYYDYSLTQQIYTAGEIGVSGSITAVSFKYAHTEPFYMEDVQIYMKHVGKGAFESDTDMVPVGSGDLVFEGTFGVDAQGWFTINLDTPFAYNGTDNLLICFYDPIDGYPGDANFAFCVTETEDNMAITYHSDVFMPDLSNLDSFGGNTDTYHYHNNIKLDITPTGVIPLDKPTSIVASDVAYNSATLTWEGGTGKYNVEYRAGYNTEWTRNLSQTTDTTCTLTGLVEETDYYFRVQSVDPDDDTSVSAWKTISFTTPSMYQAPDDLTAKLTPGNGSTATLTWTQSGTAVQWTLQYGTDSEFEEGSYSEITVTGVPSATLTGLTSDVTYYARVKAVFDEGESTWSDVVSFTPSDGASFTINNGDSSNEVVPIYGLWADDFSVSQFIIEAADLELMNGANISRLTFYTEYNEVSWGDAEFEVYMAEVSSPTFSSDELMDWNDLDKVRSAAPLAVSGGEMVVELDNPYPYTGGHLLIGFRQTEQGDYSEVVWIGTYAEGASVGGYVGGEICPHDFLPKTTFDFFVGGLHIPTRLNVSDVTDESALVSWTSDASAWTVRYREVGTAEWQMVEVTDSASCTLTGLTAATLYEVAVQAHYGDEGSSDWTRPLNFASEVCSPEDQAAVSYVLEDSYGDGWNGGYIKVVHNTTGLTVAELAATDFGGGNMASAEEGILNLCCGEEYSFEWVEASRDNEECSFAFYDVNDEEIFVFKKNNSGPADGLLFTYTMNCTLTPWRSPANLEVNEIGRETAKLSWTERGTATEWVVGYRAEGETDFTEVSTASNPFVLNGLAPETEYTVMVRPDSDDGTRLWSNAVTFVTNVAFPQPKDMAVGHIAPHSAVVSWECESEDVVLQYAKAPDYNENLYHYDNGIYNAANMSHEGNTLWGVRFPAGSYLGNMVSKVAVYDYDRMEGTLIIYNDGDTEPANPIFSMPVTLTGAKEFAEFDVGLQMIDPAKNLWIVFSQHDDYGNYVAASCRYDGTANADGRWIYTNGTWSQNYLFDHDSWMIRTQIVNGVNMEALDWIDMPEAASPCELADLEAESAYIVKAKAFYEDYGGGESCWTMLSFKTLTENPVPFDISANALTTSATLRWTGYGDSYNVRFRTLAGRATIFSEDFESSANGVLPSGWTTIDNDGDGYCWGTAKDRHAHSGNGVAASASWLPEPDNLVLSPDNWLISPALDLQGELHVWLRGQNGNRGQEHYAIYVSLSGTAPEDFSFELLPETVTTAEYMEQILDLSDFDGRRGYIAIRHFNCSDKQSLHVDDFVIYGDEYIEECEWTTLSAPDNFIQFDVRPYATYEFQIESIKDNASSGWSAPQTFITQRLSGDVNSDGLVNTDDVTALADIVLGKAAPNAAADTNQDGDISIADLTTLVNNIMEL